MKDMKILVTPGTGNAGMLDVTAREELERNGMTYRGDTFLMLKEAEYIISDEDFAQWAKDFQWRMGGYDLIVKFRDDAVYVDIYCTYME